MGPTIVTNSHVATDRVSRLLMPLSTRLVIHHGDPSSATPFPPLDRDATPPLPTATFHLQHKNSFPIRRPPAAAHPATAAPEELMPRTLSPFHFPRRIVPPKMAFLMSHPHRSAIVTASPTPAASLHHTTRLALSSASGPHQSNFRRDPDGPHAHPSLPTSICRSTTGLGARPGDAAWGGSGGAATTTGRSPATDPYRYTEEVSAFWYFFDGRERG